MTVMFEGRSQDAIVEFGITRFGPAGFDFEPHMLDGMVLIDDRGDFLSGTEPDLAARSFWGVSAFAVGDCHDCPHSTGFEADIELYGLEKAIEPLRMAIVVEAAARLAELRREVDNPRPSMLRMMALVARDFSWESTDSPGSLQYRSDPVIVGFFGLEDIAEMLREKKLKIAEGAVG